jgi:hypothetical protein
MLLKRISGSVRSIADTTAIMSALLMFVVHISNILLSAESRNMNTKEKLPLLI